MSTGRGCSDFDRSLLAASGSLEFLASQVVTTVGDLVLSRHDSLLDSALSKMRAVPPTHLFNTPFTRQGFLGRLRLVLGLLGLRLLALRRRVPLVPLALLGSGLRPRLLLVSLARRGRGPRVRLPFPHPLEAPAAPVIREEGPESQQPVRLSFPLKVEVLPGSALGTGQAIGAESWFVPVLRVRWRRLPGLSSFPLPHPCIVPDVPGRLTSGSGLTARGRGDACQRNLGNRPHFGSWLFQSPLAGGEGLWELASRDRSLSPERVRPSYSVHDGNSSFCTVICQRGGFSSFPGSEGCLPSDPNSSSLEEAMGFTSEGTVTSSTPCVSDSRPLPRSALQSA